MDKSAYANLVINTITTGPPPKNRMRVYKNNNTIRCFIFSTLPDSFPEYSFPRHIEDRYNPKNVFYMSKENHGNHFKTFNPEISVTIDSTADNTPVRIIPSSPVYRGICEYDDSGSGLSVTPVYDEEGFHRYLKEIRVENLPGGQSQIPFEFQLLTVEGDVILSRRTSLSSGQ